MQLNSTITIVFPEPRKWNSTQYPDSCSVNGLFADGSQWEVATKLGDPAQKQMDALKALIGKEGEFEVEPKPDYQGQKQWKLKNYPGKPQSGGFGGGGKGNWTPAWSQTEAGERYTQERMDRRTALMQAVSLCAGKLFVVEKGTESDVQKTADLMYAWLRASDSVYTPNRVEPAISAQNPSPQATAPSTDVVDDTPALPAMGKINTGTGLCESCFAPPGKPHAKGCTA